MRRLAIVLFLTGVCVFAQRGDRVENRRAEIRDADGHLKCRLEIVVDGAAEVAIRGDSAELRTLSGQQAEFRRFICSQPMPANPVGFRFSGIEGRGHQSLVREPARGGPAVVRIEDRQGGREAYTFDIEWRGGAGGRFDDRRDDRGRGPVGGGIGAWTGRLGGVFQYHGDGRGFLNRRNGPDTPIRDVNVSLNRAGNTAVEFEVRGFRRLVFRGQATRFTPAMVEADLVAEGRNGGSRGKAMIYIDRGGEVERVTMQGRIDGDPFTLTWSAR